MTDRWLRPALGATGVVVGGYGAYLLLSRADAHQLRSIATWLVAGVVLHDAVLAGVVIAVGLVVSRVLPRVARGPVAVGALVLGSLTLVALPVLGRFGVKADNPTLLDRDYTLGWVVVAGVVALGVVVAVLRARRGHRG